MIIYEGYYNQYPLNEAKVEIRPFGEQAGNPDYIYTLNKDNEWKPIINLRESMRKLPNEEAENACELLGKAKLISYYIGKGGYYYDKVEKAHEALKDYNDKKLKDSLAIRNSLGEDIKEALLSFYSVKSEYYKDLLFNDKGRIKHITIRISSHWEHKKLQQQELSIVFPEELSYKENSFDLNNYSVGNKEYVAGEDFINKRPVKQIAKELKELIDRSRTVPFKEIELLRILDDRVNDVYIKNKEYKNAVQLLSKTHPNMDDDYKKMIKFVIEHKDEYIHDIKKIPKFNSTKEFDLFWAIFNRLRTPEENAIFKKARSEYDKHRYDSTGGVIPSKSVRGYDKFYKLMTKYMSTVYEDKKYSYDDLYQWMTKQGLTWRKPHLQNIIKTYNYENPDKQFVPKLKRANRYDEFKDIIMLMTGGLTNSDDMLSIDDWIDMIKEESGIEMTKQMFMTYYKKLLQEYPNLILIKTRKLSPRIHDTVIEHINNYCKKSHYKQTVQEWIEYFESYKIDITKSQLLNACKEVEAEHPEYAPIVKMSANELLYDDYDGLIVYEGYFNDKEISNDDIVSDIEQSELNKPIEEYTHGLRLELSFNAYPELFSENDSTETVAKKVCRQYYNRLIALLDNSFNIDDFENPIFTIFTEENKENKIFDINNMRIRPGRPALGGCRHEIDIDFHFNPQFNDVNQLIKFMTRLIKTLSFKNQNNNLKPHISVCFANNCRDCIERNNGFDWFGKGENIFHSSTYDIKGKCDSGGYTKKHYIELLLDFCEYFLPDITEKEIKKVIKTSLL